MVTAAMEGTRPVLVEIQGLCVTTAFAHPKRTTLGVDATRISLLAAVLERSTGLSLAGQDLFVNVAGGVNLSEPAADLPVILAIASSMQNRVLPADMIAVGEVGLSGEIRGVPRMEARLQEAAKMGFKQVLLPKTSAQKVEVPEGIELLPVATLEHALDLVGAQ
jgi:DNA repair protein RadA/Sms